MTAWPIRSCARAASCCGVSTRSTRPSMTRRADGTPIRLASKSVRCRRLTTDTLATPGFRGILAFTLPEALWLAEWRTSDDIVVAYPTADQAAPAKLAGHQQAAMAITVMVDSIKHLDLIARAIAAAADPHRVRVAIDIDAGYRARRAAAGRREAFAGPQPGGSGRARPSHREPARTAASPKLRPVRGLI
jgi:D-serine deaminase-like pyridoxal phosphate-dependent protein